MTGAAEPEDICLDLEAAAWTWKQPPIKIEYREAQMAPEAHSQIRSVANLSDLLSETEEALAALDDIDVRYERERAELLNWLGPEQSKKRLLARLQERRRADREPLVQRLLEVRVLLERSRDAARSR